MWTHQMERDGFAGFFWLILKDGSPVDWVATEERARQICEERNMPLLKTRSTASR